MPPACSVSLVSLLGLVRADTQLSEQNLCKNPREPFLMWSAGNQSSPRSPPSTAQRNPIEGKKEAARGLGKPAESFGGDGRVTGLIVPISTEHLNGWGMPTPAQKRLCDPTLRMTAKWCVFICARQRLTHFVLHFYKIIHTRQLDTNVSLLRCTEFSKTKKASVTWRISSLF